MLGWTTRHFRYLIRLFTRQTLLYTEMVTVPALLNGPAHPFLYHRSVERPLALQLGGDDPMALAECAQMAEAAGFEEVNLNVGCPSDRVQQGHFGACLMASPSRVARAVTAMKAAVSIPVTVKHRLGIDGHEEYAFLHDFVQNVVDAGCDRIIVHARVARLNGLSPRENRSVPPLRYHDVYRLKSDFSDTAIVINGGISDIDTALEHLSRVDGVMIGRYAYTHPEMFAGVDHRVYQSASPSLLTRREVLGYLARYVESEVQAGTPLMQMTRHFMGLFRGQAGARQWRQLMGETARRVQDPGELFDRAQDVMPSFVLDTVLTEASPQEDLSE
jgi:tRNA-dihydrouridine synthase A